MQTAQQTVFTYGTWTNTAYSKPYEFTKVGNTSVTLTTRLRNYTDTIKRVYPLDGYLLSTTRTTVTDLYSISIIDYCTGATNATKYTNFPLWSLYSRSATTRYTAQSGGSVLQDPVTSLSRDSMYNTIRSHLKDEKTNLANMLGEYRETAETFLQLTEAVITRGKSLLRRHKSGLKRGRADFASTVSTNHLGFTYGIRPLAQDMGTAVAELRSAVVAAPPFKEGVVKRRDRVSNSGWRSPNSTTYTRRAKSEVIKVTSYRTQWRAYMNQNALLLCLAEHGMLNAASLAWELMPYSFVLDWWFNVGDVLSSLDNLLICDKLEALDSSSVRTFEYCKTPLDNLTLVCQQGFYAGRTDSRRAVVEIPRVSTLSYKPSLSVGHILNGLALLHVASKRL